LQLTILTPILDKIANKNNKIINILIISISPIYLIIIDIIRIVLLKDISHVGEIFPAWLSFYYIGILYRNNSIRELNNKKSVIYNVISLITLIIFIFCIDIFLYYKVGMSYNYVTSQIKLISFIYSIFMIYLIMKIRHINIKTNNILVELGNYSYGIYYVHTGVIMVLNKILSYLSINYYCELLIKIVLVITISYFGIKIFKRMTKGKVDKVFGI